MSEQGERKRSDHEEHEHERFHEQELNDLEAAFGHAESDTDKREIAGKLPAEPEHRHSRITSDILSDHGAGAMNNVNEEMGAEMAANDFRVFGGETEESETAERANEDDRGYALGWVALVFAGASWFIWPVLLGATAAVLGFIAYKEGARGLGGWSMAIGLFALALNLIIVPFYYAVT